MSESQSPFPNNHIGRICVKVVLALFFFNIVFKIIDIFSKYQSINIIIIFIDIVCLILLLISLCTLNIDIQIGKLCGICPYGISPFLFCLLMLPIILYSIVIYSMKYFQTYNNKIKDIDLSTSSVTNIVNFSLHGIGIILFIIMLSVYLFMAKIKD